MEMKTRFLHSGRALRAALLALLIGAGATNLCAQNITFADPAVKAICVAPETGWDTNGDNELSYAEAAAVTDLGTVFQGNTSITTFDELEWFVNDNMESISSYAFSGCTNLTSITLPERVREIFEEAFSGCTSLSSITLPLELQRINRKAFSGCTSLSSITLPEHVGEIDDEAFSGCTSLSSITLSEYVWVIGGKAFSGCTSLSSITLPSRMSIIGREVFSGCTGLTSITVEATTPPYAYEDSFGGMDKSIPVYIPDGTLTQYQAADGWKELSNFVDMGTAIVFADANVEAICVSNWDTNIDYELSYTEAAAVTTLDDNFRGNIDITSFDELKYFTGLNSINIHEFSYCINLQSITIPASVETIESYAFWGCDRMTVITVEAITPPTVEDNNSFLGVDNSIPVYVPCGQISAYREALGWNYFTNFKPSCGIEFADANVKAICLANWDDDSDGNLSYDEAAAVTDLGRNFTSNTSITSFDELQYFTGLIAIGEFAFSGCTSLTSIIIPNSVTNIMRSAFKDCSNLQSITIPASVLEIVDNPFENCAALESITVEAGNSVFASPDGCNAIIKTSAPTTLLVGCKNTVIPATLEFIGKKAFKDCTGLTSITLPESVSYIYSDAFSGCTGLTAMTVNATTPPNLGSNVFENVDKNIPVRIPSGTLASYQAVMGWSDFLNYIDPMVAIEFADAYAKAVCLANWDTNGDEEMSYGEAAAVTDLGMAFMVNSNIGTFDELQYFTGLTSIAANAFLGCTSLTSITLPESITAIGQSAFAACTGLTSITLPQAVATIGSSAFSGCTGLTSITLPQAVATIGSSAFSGCTGLTSVFVETTVAPTIGGSSGISTTVPVFLPCGSLEAYQFAEGWYGLKLVENCIIEFADANVKAICLDNWDTNGDGKLSAAEATVVTSFGTAFNGNTAITSFDEMQHFIGVASINDDAFAGCTGLASVTIPATMAGIGNNAFAGCTGLTSLTVKATTPPTVGSNAFENVDKTIPVYIPDGTIGQYKTATGWSEFFNFVDATVIIFADANVKAICVANWDTNGDGELSYAEAAAVNNDDLAGVFNQREDIVTFNELQYFTGLTEIFHNAFEDCTNLASVTLPAGITLIDNYAFSGCEKLTNISIPEGVITIEAYAFSYSGLESIDIPASVETIGVWAFAACNNLQSINVNPYNGHYTSNGNCNVIVETATNTLMAGCPNSSVYEGIKSIKTGAFAHMTGVTTMELPSTLESIESRAFYFCTNLAEITCQAVTPPNCGSEAFFQVNKDIPVYVPCGSNAAYQEATGWSEFTNRIEVQCVVEFISAGDWSDASNWQGGALPTAYDNVIISSACELDMAVEVASLSISDYCGIMIGEGGILTVTGDMNMETSSYVNIYDGGQLVHSVEGIVAMVEKVPAAYSDVTVSDGWNLIASPLKGTIATSSVLNLLDHDYDLYYYDEPTHYWMNEKNPDNDFTTLKSGQGYLFSINVNDQLGFDGTINSGTKYIHIPLSYTDEAGRLKGFNLVGNPFVHNVTTFAGNEVAEEVYRLNSDGSNLIVDEISAAKPLKPCEGFFVKAEQEGAYITFNARSGGERERFGRINLELSANGKLIDRFIVKDGGNALEKLTMKDDATMIFAERDSQKMAVVPAEGNEQAVSFKAAKNDTYTLNVNVEGMNLSYLHLIDNMTGADVDLLATPSYTFNAKMTDYASRFRLVFNASSNAADGSFAFIDGNGNIVVNGAEAGATLQIVDMMGRVVLSTDVARNVSTQGIALGVYVLRLIDGNDVKTLKIVVR